MTNKMDKELLEFEKELEDLKELPNSEDKTRRLEKLISDIENIIKGE